MQLPETRGTETTPGYRILFIVGRLLGVLLMALVLFGFAVLMGAGFSIGAHLVDAATPQKAPEPVFVRVFSGASHRGTHRETEVVGADETLDAPPFARTAAPPTPSPSVSNRLSNIRLTWYCLEGRSRCTRGYPDGLYAAASPDLAYLRGKTVTVTYAGRSVAVTVIDCSCQATRSLDLYADAFRKLAPLSRGVIYGELR